MATKILPSERALYIPLTLREKDFCLRHGVDPTPKKILASKNGVIHPESISAGRRFLYTLIYLNLELLK